MVRVGIVGIGDAGRHHARASMALADEGKLAWTAVVARDAERFASFAGELAVPESVTRYPDLEALLAANACDAIVLATPDGLHAAQVEHVARRGLPVLVEKPLGLDAAEGARAIEVARRAGVHLAVGYQLRHHAAHQAMAAMLGRIGALQTIHVRWAWPDPAVAGWRARGEGARFWSLAALGTHAIDLVLGLSRSPPRAVVAVTHPPTGIDRKAEVSLAFDDGLVAHVSVAVTHRAMSRVVVTGTEGELEARGTMGARGDGELVFRGTRGPDERVAFTPQNPYESQLRAFVRDLSGGFSEDPFLGRGLEVLDAIDRSRRPS